MNPVCYFPSSLSCSFGVLPHASVGVSFCVISLWWNHHTLHIKLNQSIHKSFHCLSRLADLFHVDISLHFISRFISSILACSCTQCSLLWLLKFTQYSHCSVSETSNHAIFYFNYQFFIFLSPHHGTDFLIMIFLLQNLSIHPSTYMDNVHKHKKKMGEKKEERSL